MQENRTFDQVFGSLGEESTPNQRTASAALDAHTDHDHRGFDLACPNNDDTFKPLDSTCGTPRFTAWKREFDDYVRQGNLPTVQFVRLPNDPHQRHQGREPDAQNGPDHVDAHRTISQVISPYTQYGKVDSTTYSTASMLHTVENIVGVSPLSQFDTFATPMTAAFGRSPRLRPHTVERPSQAGEHPQRRRRPDGLAVRATGAGQGGPDRRAVVRHRDLEELQGA